ncbi:hypothetical protein FOC46_22270 [Citrobacter portucalensis]|uniref:hypothetical protein n=1 Tax=Citrobacter portucalensis TaxID=1639133 RepID=UPI00024132D3|nr:hypothetical protein [Citrobacter portucalensis]EHL80497.1 hypothetical protein HMPREF9428_01876 [Citrobacter portucalensis]QGS16090.1 hypothetical protein FOC46_22270 [Citrobacter portucalensis]
MTALNKQALREELEVCSKDRMRRMALALLDELESAEKRIAELEARTVTLPEPFKMAKSSSGLTYYYADEVDAAIQAAGIGVKGE